MFCSALQPAVLTSLFSSTSLPASFFSSTLASAVLVSVASEVSPCAAGPAASDGVAFDLRTACSCEKRILWD